MIKKLKLYCILLVCVLVFHLLSVLIHVDKPKAYVRTNIDRIEFGEAPNEYYDVNDSVKVNGGDGWGIRHVTNTVAYNVYVKPKDTSHDRGLFSVTNTNDEVYKINLHAVSLQTPSRRVSKTPFIYQAAAGLLVVLVVICIIIIVFKLIGNFRKGRIFVTQVSRYLEIAGILLTALYLLEFTFSYLYAQYCIKHIYLAEYYVVFENDVNIMYILTGLGLMIISQIILMGKDLKEEQDLTI